MRLQDVLISRFARVGRITLFVTGLLSVAALPSTGDAVAQSLTPEAAAAKAFVEPFMSGEVTWAGPTSSPKPIAGKRLAVVSCCQAAEGAARPVRAMVEAGRSIGWTVDVFDGKGDPQEQNKAVNAAIDSKYDGIALVFVDTPVVAEGVNRAVNAKIPLITLGSMKNTPESVPDVSPDYIKEGQAIANYMIWKSNGKINSLLLKNTDLYVVKNGEFKGTYDVLTNPTQCKNCTADVREWTLSNLDSQPASIASAALQADPGKNWVSCFDACMSRVARALTASGLGSGVWGAGFDCNGENLQLIKDDEVQVVSVCDPRDWVAYAVIDSLNRMMQGQPVAAQTFPALLLDKDNITKLSDKEVEQGWQGGYDFRSKYRTLWGVN